jgi:hypothetical protein
VLWSRVATTTGQARITPTAIATDIHNNVFVTGHFNQGTLAFGNYILPGPALAYDNLFIVKYDSSGNFLWARDANAGTGYVECQSASIALDHQGNAFITGAFRQDSFSAGGITLYNHGSYSYFMVKYDPAGNTVWTKEATGNINNRGTAIATDATDNIYVSGSFSADSITFDSHTFFSHDSIAAHLHPYTIKYDPAGHVLWVKDLGAYILTSDMNHSIYTANSFLGDSIALGPITLYNPTPTHNEFYIAKYDTSGQIQWAKKVGTYPDIYLNSIATNADGILFASGGFSNPAALTLDSIAIAIPPNPTDPMFIASYDKDGHVLCATALSSGGDDQNSVCADPFGNAYITGDFLGPGPFIVGADTFFISHGGNWGVTEEIFTTKFNCPHKTETGAKDIVENSIMSLYPNPSRDHATLRYQLPSDARTGAVLGFDIIGSKINEYTLDSTAGEIIIDTTRLANGVYFYSLFSNGKSVGTRKLVIER